MDPRVAREKLDIAVPPNSFVVGFVGSFKWYHRVDALLDAIAGSEMNEVRLVLVGDGPERAKCERQAEDLGLGERALFVGSVEHERVGLYLAACDVLYGAIDPRHWGHPIKVYEYMAAGRPVIASRSRDLRFVEEIRAGMLLDDVTKGSVRSAIRRLAAYSGPERERMGQNGRDRVAAEHTWDHLARSILDSLSD